MPTKRFDSLLGKTYGRLSVLERAPNKYVGNTAWLCRCECGEETTVTGSALRKGATKSCGCLRRELATKYGEDNSSWKGGRSIDEQGYIRLRGVVMPDGSRPDHIFEHRYVFYTNLGRMPLPGENVHHINGDKTDNRLENLELWRSSQPKGQRVADLVAWAREIIETYGDIV